MTDTEVAISLERVVEVDLVTEPMLSARESDVLVRLAVRWRTIPCLPGL